MRIPLNWLKKFVEIKVSDEELVRLIGARLVEVEEVIDERQKYDNIYVVKVAKAEKIPDTHLTLCQIDVGGGELAKESGAGEDGLVQVVCGAPNVREGMLAVWLKPGAVVPASVHEDAPFVIGKRKMLKKYESNGMLAGADELDFDDKHEKIVEIDPAMAKPGDLLADVFDLRDQILDIENKSLTHRPDCFGLVGFAREVAGILGQKFEAQDLYAIHFSESGEPLVSEPSLRKGCAHDPAQPKTDSEKVSRAVSVENSHVSRKRATDLLLSGHTQGRSAKPTVPKEANSAALKIKIADEKICPRYSAVVLEKHGKIEEKYLTQEQIWLAKAGMRTIDPIVDATNYLMLLTGQPLHAFDYNKFVKVGKTKKPEIGVRLAKKGEKLRLLDDKEVELNENDIVITSGKVPVALAGAMGGESTEIDENTKNIIIESATFSLYNLRKTQMAHGIFSEAITRFTKGQPAYQTVAVALECAEMLAEGFKIAEIADEYPQPAKQIVVKITTDAVNDLLGTDYSAGKITRTLENVGMKVTANAGKAEMNVVVPAWRTDLHIPEDIIEEVGRLLGYDNIEPVLPLHQTASRSGMLEVKKQIRGIMRRLGANEVLTYSFVSGRLLEKAELETKNSYKIVNSISPELQLVRQSLVPSLLDKAYVNQKIPFDKFALFEMNKVYRKDLGMDEEGVPVESSWLGCVIAERKGTGTAYYKAKKYVERLIEELGVEIEVKPLETRKVGAEAKPFEPKRTGEVLVAGTDEVLGVVGEFKNSVRNAFKLAPFLAGFELNLDALSRHLGGKRELYFGEIEKRDLTVTTEKSYAEVVEMVKKVLAKYKREAEISPLGIYQAEGQDRKNISVHLEFHGKVPKKLMEALEKIN